MRAAASASRIVAALGGRWAANHGMCRCPAHQDGTPSLSVTCTPEGRVLLHCFAGCKGTDVIAALRQRGLWPGRAERPPVQPVLTPETEDQAALRKRRRALSIWQAAVPVAGTLGEVYLRSRRIRAPLPDSLRFLARHDHIHRPTAHPALIAAVQDPAGTVIAIQRTWLCDDGRGKAALDPPKAGLGPMDDGAVRLRPPADLMGLAEGVETALSAAELYSLPVWATLGAHRLGQVRLPEICRAVVIFADDGATGLKQARQAARLLGRQGRTVRIERPPRGFGDFNDWARAKP
ncbi:MAG: toprim domain-containing protein [Alphaproteobacteria bacterium]|nr:toprim domain-containing protein [Alphaproteobacteria bacterium]MCW5738571.1 toprim domain-containing protein [Alphaproteobacteria bacterium]